MIPRIGLVIGQLGQGGAERQLTILATGLKQSTLFEPVVYCLSQWTSPFGEELEYAGVEWHYPPVWANSPILKSAWLIHQLMASPCDLLYGFLNVGSVYAWCAAWTLHIPFISSVRSSNKNLPFIIRFLSGKACAYSNEVIVNSPSCADSLAQVLKVTNKNPITIPNGIKPIEIEQSLRLEYRSKLSIAKDGIIIGTLASLRKEKRPDFFIDVAIFMLGQMIPDFTSRLYFIWVGEGIERNAVDHCLNELPSSISHRIKFPGSSSKVEAWLSCFDVFILTSDYEGLSNSLMEAMSAGVPCIATAVKGTVDLLDPLGKEILIWTPPDDPIRYAQILYELINDKQRMAQMGRYAQEYIRGNFTTAKMIESHCMVFEKVLSNHRR